MRPDSLTNEEERNTSRHTLKHWELYLRYFVTWCDERGLTRPAEVTRPILERYQRHLFLKRKEKRSAAVGDDAGLARDADQKVVLVAHA